MRVKDVMTADVTTVRPGASLREVASILAGRRISGLPVVDQGGELLGVVSEGDILMKEQGRKDGRGGVLGWLVDRDAGLREDKFGARTAGEAMTAPAITAGPTDRIAKAASLMVENDINRLPVVERGRLVGIVTRADLVRAFTQTDSEIAVEIREDVIGRQLWMAPESLVVEVYNGQVELSGETETEQLAELLPTLVEKVAGVVSVTSNLRWQKRGAVSGARKKLRT